MQVLGLIVEALDFAAKKHRDQRRKDHQASPYINHPIALMTVLCNEAQVIDIEVLCAAILHDTVEDTETTVEELEACFGATIAAIVEEVTDDISLPKVRRKQQQIEHAPHISHKAQLVKLTDKICNLRDLSTAPPAGWKIERKREYFDWAKAVVDRLRGTHAHLEALFDQACARKP